MKNVNSFLSHHLQLALLVLLIVLGAMSTECNAQRCGQPKGTNACPLTCGAVTNYEAMTIGSDIAYVINADVDCGDICGMVNTNIILTSCYPTLSIEAMTPESFSKLRELAGGREILVPGCGEKFEALKDLQVTRASAQTRMAAGISLSITDSAPLSFAW